MERKVLEPAKKTESTELIKKAVRDHATNKVKVSGYKFLIFDIDYKVYKSKVLSGKIRSLARDGELSVINLRTLQGMNSPEYATEYGEEWLDINDFED